MRKRSNNDESPSCLSIKKKNASLGHHSQIVILQAPQRKGKHNPIDSVNESIIWKIDPLVVAATSMRNEQWIFQNNLSVFSQIERFLNG